ncbi:MAG: T9SS type A sorting domain-containing protein, partial [Candidatus Cloacimonetes bacterium]|nr:T9SS type A sorting domain-containing protein [Candidatus Cloacimonadota bacterium]
GFDTLGYYYPFDMDYNHRVWDGDGNGTEIIDIGPYEYGAPSFGGIEGYTYNPTTSDPVDYVLLKINNQPGEFTFSDSLGNFQFKLPAGTYDVYAERVFYENVIQYEIEVFDGLFTQIAIPMIEIVDVGDYEITKSEFLISNLSNFPNPFNPSTTISFNLKNSSNVKLIVYNVKGQKVKTLINDQYSKGAHSVIWNGKDKNNKPVSSGLYFYKLSSGKETQVKKMLLLK